MDAVPWSAVLASDLSALSAASCSFFVASGSGDPIPALILVEPQEVAALDPEERVVVWFQPAVPFEPETDYSLSCGLARLPFDDVEFRTSAATADAVPTLAVSAAREVEYGSCCGGVFLQLDLGAGVARSFFDEGGVLLLEYSGGRRSYASGFYEASAIDAPPPSDDDDVIVVTPISGRHEIGVAVTVDVATIGPSSRCAHGRLPSGAAWLGLLLVLRRRSSAPPPGS